mgnify:FL=1
MPEYDGATYDAYAEDFKSGYELGLQQRMSKFDPYVTMAPPLSGDSATIINIVEPFEAQVGGDDLGDTEWSIPEFNTRWAFPVKIRAAIPVTTDDQLYTLSDPSNPLIQSTLAAHRRAMDNRIILPAMFRDVTGGKDKGKTFSFDPVNHVVAKSVGGADTSLNYYKLVELRQKMLELEVDLDAEPITIAIPPQVEAHLLHLAEAKNSDFNKLGIVISNGRVTSAMGCNIVVSNMIEKDPTGVTWYCPAWVRSGIGVQSWLNPWVRISERDDKNYTTQVFAEMRAGAARMMEGKVFRVECHVGQPANP